MASPLVTLEPLLQICIDYLTERQAWNVTRGSRDDLPHQLKAMEDELNEPRLDWLAYGGWRTSLRLARHLAGVRRQPTLMLCRYTVAAAAMGLLAHATAIPHFRLILGLISNREMAETKLAAQTLTGLPLQLAHFGAVTECPLFSSIVLDHPLDHQQECELARSSAMAGATILSPLSTTSL